MEGAVVPEILFEFVIHRSVPKTFAIKVESCHKSRQILDVLRHLKFLGACLPKAIPILSPLPRGISRGKKFCEDTPTSPEVIRAHTLNFRPNFKFSGLNFFKGTPIPDVVCASKFW